MSWPESSITSWDDFVNFVEEAITIGTPLSNTYMFRGQSDSSWSLVSSLLRYLPKKINSQDAVDIEKGLLREFTSQAHLHINQSIIPRFESDLIEWWTVMQHHGAPTRLLDWTRSPYVAIYFAVDQRWDQDGAVWLFNSDSVLKHANKTYNKTYNNGNRRDLKVTEQVKFFWDPNATNEPMLAGALRRSNRIVAQQGSFFVCGQILANHYDVIEKSIKTEEPDASRWYRKLIIPSHLKPEILARLEMFNLTASSLFPGIDGLGRSLTETARVVGAYYN